MTARETLARELTAARDRTLRLVDFDDAELRRQYDPLMSPLVWDLAHIGQQEELWLLRDGDPRPAGHAAARTSSDSTTRSCIRAPAGSTCRCCRRPTPEPTARPCGTRRWTTSTRCPTTTTAFNFGLGDQPREPARRDHAAGAEPAIRAAAVEHRIVLAARPFGSRGHLGARARGGVRPWRRRGQRAALARQRAARARRRRARVPHRPGPGDQRRVAPVHRRRRVPAAALVVGPRLDASAGGGTERAAVLEPRRHPHPLRACRGDPRRRTRAARHLLRGRGVRGVGRRAPAHRGGMGKGRRLGPRDRARVADSLGAHRNPPNTWQISVATRCVPPRSVPIRRERRPTASNRCWATCGSGQPRRCGRGRASRR